MKHPGIRPPARQTAFVLTLGMLALGGCVSQPQVAQPGATGGSASAGCPVTPDPSVTSTVKVGFSEDREP